MIEFSKTVKQSKIRSPLKNFEEETITFEYRVDPLTGRNTTVIKDMLGYVSKFFASDADLLNSLVEKTRATCPFCPESISAKTPMFTKDFLPKAESSAAKLPWFRICWGTRSRAFWQFLAGSITWG